MLKQVQHDRASVAFGSMLEPHKQPSEVLTVLIDAVILGLDVLLFQKTDHGLFKLSAPFAGYDLNDRDLLLNRFVNDVIQGLIDLLSFIEDLVKVECEFGH